MNPYSVFIIDDDEAMRHAMLLLLRGEGFRARAFVSATDFLENLPVEKSACIITDIRMSQTSGVELVERLKALRGPAWPIIAVTGHGDVSLAVQLMKAGVVDFIEKPFDPNRILEAVRSCINQMSGAEAERDMKDATCARLATLTPRERQVFDALIEGKSNKMIALDLEISPRRRNLPRQADAENAGPQPAGAGSHGNARRLGPDRLNPAADLSRDGNVATLSRL